MARRHKGFCHEAPQSHPVSRTPRILAWSVHGLTASGVVCSLLAMDAGWRGNWRPAFAWLAVAVVIDAVDGTLARMARVKTVLPNFDGTLLDNLVDYVSYVLVPAFFLFYARLLPIGTSMWMAAIICLSSSYQFCQIDAKTDDHYFKGFPSYWNVAVLYLFALGLSPLWNLAILILLVVLVFTPVKYVYPSRTPEFRRTTLLLTSLWGLSIIAIIWKLPEPPIRLVALSMFYIVYYVGISVYLMLFPRRGNRDLMAEDVD